jgi:DNA-directed RNA polymerase specialized sigma24 family protein
LHPADATLTYAVVRGLIRDRAKLLGCIWAIVRDYHLADDVFQEVMVLAIERSHDISGDDHLLLWARKVARLKSCELLRKNTLRTRTLADDVLETLEVEWKWADALTPVGSLTSPKLIEVVGRPTHLQVRSSSAESFRLSRASASARENRSATDTLSTFECR